MEVWLERYAESHPKEAIKLISKALCIAECRL